MKILIFHAVHLPPRDYGGVERVVLWLGRGLRDLGHEVTIAALSGSTLPPGIQLLPIDPNHKSDEVLLERLPAGTDIVHFMAPPSALTQAKLNSPFLLTVHGNGKPGESYPTNSVFLSQDHANRHGSETFVYNGIDPDEYRFENKKSDWALFLSKTSWKVKNVDGAARYAKKAGCHLKIAGGNRPYGLRLQSLFSPNLRWVGPVSGDKKARLLAEAKFLLFPIRWAEPFGLVMAEAWMSGTPVLASPLGSAREMVSSEVGLLPANDFEWDEAIRTGFRALKPEACREWAIKKFHYQKMCENYESLYKRTITGEKLI